MCVKLGKTPDEIKNCLCYEGEDLKEREAGKLEEQGEWILVVWGDVQEALGGRLNHNKLGSLQRHRGVNDSKGLVRNSDPENARSSYECRRKLRSADNKLDGNRERIRLVISTGGTAIRQRFFEPDIASSACQLQGRLASGPRICEIALEEVRGSEAKRLGRRDKPRWKWRRIDGICASANFYYGSLQLRFYNRNPGGGTEKTAEGD
ncbi:hypothetical protein B0H14DRAFT_2591589 [Mycena olivaceomarginata]|nr:hypothetical protein B0H14DRAFT_2591589 [Mycena olivaceomarginata]